MPAGVWRRSWPGRDGAGHGACSSRVLPWHGHLMFSRRTWMPAGLSWWQTLRPSRRDCNRRPVPDSTVWTGSSRPGGERSGAIDRPYRRLRGQAGRAQRRPAGLLSRSPAAQALFEGVVAIDELSARQVMRRSVRRVSDAGRPRRRARFALAATVLAVVAGRPASLSPRPCTMRHQRLPRSPSGTSGGYIVATVVNPNAAAPQLEPPSPLTI